MNIGLLEDNPAILEYMQTALEMAGHHVYIHKYGASLLDALFAAHHAHVPLPYDLVIVDLYLPGNMSGLEVITSIQQSISAKILPLIVVSAASQEELEKVQTRFALPTLQKPFQRHKLLQLIEKSTLKPDSP